MIEWRIPREPKKSAFWFFDNYFLEEDLNIIEKCASLVDEEEGKVATHLPNTFDTVDSYRKSKVKWLRHTLPNMNKIYQKLVDAVISANANNFCKAIYGIEMLQYTIYDGSYEGFYGKHFDCSDDFCSPTYERKISFSVQLSDPSEYEGGDLIIHHGTQSTAPKDKGTITFFDSSTFHEVTPVTKGIRKSLVGWVH